MSDPRLPSNPAFIGPVVPATPQPGPAPVAAPTPTPAAKPTVLSPDGGDNRSIDTNFDPNNAQSASTMNPLPGGPTPPGQVPNFASVKDQEKQQAQAGVAAGDPVPDTGPNVRQASALGALANSDTGKALGDKTLEAMAEKYTHDGQIKPEDYQHLVDDINNASQHLTTKEGKPASIEQKTKEIEELDKQAAEAKKGLDYQLNQFGAALTPEQRADFEKQYRAANPVMEQAETEKSKMSAYLQSHQEELLADVRTPPLPIYDHSHKVIGHKISPKAQAAIDAMKAISPEHAGVAVDFATKVLQDPAALASGAGDEVINKLVVPNVAAFQSSLVKQYGGDIAKATAAMNAQLGPALGNYAKNAVEGGKTAQEHKETVEKALELQKFVGKLQTATETSEKGGSVLSRLADLAKEEKDGKGPLGTTLGALALVTGAYSTGVDVSEGKWLDAVKDLASTSGGAIELLHDFGEAAQWGTSGLKFLSKAAPMLSVVSASIQAYQDGSELRKDHNGTNLGIVLGDVAVVLGTAGLVTGSVFAAPLVAVGLLTTAGFKALKEDQKHLKEQATVNGIMQNLHPPLDKITAEALTAMGPYKMEQLQTDYGLSPEQIVDLLQNQHNPSVLNLPDTAQPGNVYYKTYVKQMFTDPKTGKLDGAAFATFLNAQAAAGRGATNDPAWANGGVEQAANYINDRVHLNANASPREWGQALQKQLDELNDPRKSYGGTPAMRKVIAAQLQVMIDQTRTFSGSGATK